MAKEIVNRRRFLSGTAGAIATGTALHLAPDKSSSLKEMASVLHDAVGRYSDQNAPFHFGACPLDDRHPLMYAMERLRDCSADEIQYLLRPLYENIEGGAS